MAESYRQPTVQNWLLAIEDGLEFRRKYGREAEWARCEALFYQGDVTQSENVGANIIASTGDALLSTLLVPNPQFVIRPLQMETVESAPVLESVLNQMIYNLKLKQTMQEAGLHCYLYGRGIIKHGYDSEFGYDPRQDMGQEFQTILGMTTSQFDKRGRKIEFGGATPGMPWAATVLPHDFVVPWGTKSDLSTAPWCAHRIVRHIDDIKADPKYTNKSKLVPQLSLSDWVKSYLHVMKPYRMGTYSSNFTTPRSYTGPGCVEYVEMWEIHDYRTGRIYVVAQDHPEFLRNDIDYLQEDGLPFTSFSFVPTARTFWTTPDTVYLQSTQREIIDISQMQWKQRRISLLRFLYAKGMIRKDELSKFMSGDVGLGVEVETLEQQSIVSMSPSNNNNQLQVESDAVRRNARETVGFNQNQMGEYEGTGRRTASEAMIVQQNADQRLNRRQDLVAEAYIDCGKKISKTLFKFWKTPRIIEVLGQTGAAQWTSFTGSDLRGDYQFKIGFSSEPVEGLQARRQKAINLFTFLSQDPGIDQLELRRFFARNFNDPEVNRLFLPGVLNNANLSNAMQQLSPPMGGVPAQGNVGGGAPKPQPSANMPGVQPPVGQPPI